MAPGEATVDAVPASAALRRSWTPPRITPSRTRSTRRFGVPSKSKGSPIVSGESASS